MHAIYDSRITLKLFCAKNGCKKNITFEKMSCLKSSFLYCLFFLPHLHSANFIYKFAIFGTFEDGLISRILARDPFHLLGSIVVYKVLFLD